MKKKIILLVIIPIFILAAFIALVFTFREKKEKPPAPLPRFLREPAIPKYAEGYAIETTLAEGDFSFPKNISVLELIPGAAISEDEARKIAANLGFTTEPSVSDDVSFGKTYIWSRSLDSLVVYSLPKRIEYSLNRSPAAINKQLSHEALIKLSEDFLVGKSLVSPDEIDFSFFTFFESVGPPEGFYITTKEKASVFQVNFSPIKSDFKLVTLDPRSSPVYTWLAPDGTVSKAIVTKLDSISFSGQKYSLKDYNSFVSSLDKATLVTLDDGNILLSVLPKASIRKIVVSDVELAYLLDAPEAKTAQPVYLLKGRAVVKEYSDEVNAVLYLPAIEGP